MSTLFPKKAWSTKYVENKKIAEQIDPMNSGGMSIQGKCLLTCKSSPKFTSQKNKIISQKKYNKGGKKISNKNVNIKYYNNVIT
jgi:hypothetical protein